MQRETADWKTRGSRRGVSLVGTAHRQSGPTCRVLITNLSYEGCTVIAEETLNLGETLSLQLPNQGNIAAQVRWIVDEKAGMRFLLGGSAVEDRRARLGV